MCIYIYIDSYAYYIYIYHSYKKRENYPLTKVDFEKNGKNSHFGTTNRYLKTTIW